VVCVLFFFSSRRRHTRSKRDWSSDVCSSDLLEMDLQGGQVYPGDILKSQADGAVAADAALEQLDPDELDRAARGVIVGSGLGDEIGRASCRERVWSLGVARAVEREEEW